MAKQLTIPPPPEGIPISGEDRTSTPWQTWFNALYSILNSQGLTNYPPVVPGGGDQPFYWHKLYDPAWMHMYFNNAVAGKVVPAGSVIDNYERHFIDPFQVDANLVAGTVTANSDEYIEEGIYHMSISIFGDIGNNSTTIVGLYQDGVASGVQMTLVTKSVPTTTAVFSGAVPVTDGVYDLRVIAGSTLTIYTIGWSAHRISPLPSWEG